MKTTAVLLATALFAGSAFAADHGIGLSAKSDNGLIYFPIDVSPRFRIEPHVRYSTDDSAARGAAPPGVPAAVSGDSETLEAGAGLFGLALPKESVRVYYGARIGYLNVETVYTISAGPVTVRDSETSDGYRIAPTFGFEYLFNSHFTLGGEVAYFYQHLESEETFQSGSSDFESDRTGTEGFLILRYFF